MKLNPPTALTRASIFACIVAIFIGIYKSDHAYDHMVRQEWLPQEFEPHNFISQLPRSNSLFFEFITNSSRFTASELHQFQLWLTDAFSSRFTFSNDTTRVGLTLAKKGLKAKHPVVIIPGSLLSCA